MVKEIMEFIIHQCNPEWNENISEDEAFINALKLADGFWKVYIKHAIAEVEAIEIILEKIEKCKECYLIFETEMPYRKAMKYIDNENVKYIIFKSRREGYDVRTVIDSCKFKSEIINATDINISRKLTKIDDLIYVDVHGKLCCTKTLESAISFIIFTNENIDNSAGYAIIPMLIELVFNSLYRNSKKIICGEKEKDNINMKSAKQLIYKVTTKLQFIRD